VKTDRTLKKNPLARALRGAPAAAPRCADEPRVDSPRKPINSNAQARRQREGEVELSRLWNTVPRPGIAATHTVEERGKKWIEVGTW